MQKLANALMLALLLSSTGSVDAYQPETHEIAERAADPAISSVDEALKGELAATDGVSTTVSGRTIQRWVGEGAAFEDNPFTRSLNHFHNPLAPWSSAGLTGVFRGQSSVLWQQNQSQNSSTVYTPLPFWSGGGNWSWQDARQHYVNALVRGHKETLENEPGRDQAFLDTFLALGHLTHLIQDASVPAHTRNDPHPLYEGYESWVEAMRLGGTDLCIGDRRALFLSLLNTDPVPPLPSIFTATADPQAPVPIARLIDTDVFTGLNTGVLTGASQGIAEYTNGNFVSDDTIFVDFALPRPESLDPAFSEPACGSSSKRTTYSPKVTDGEPVTHFVAEGTFSERLRFRGRPERNDILNDRVYQDYATLLLRRAVGYSAALLEYFFRAKLDVDLVADPADASKRKLVGKLVSSTGPPNELVAGTLALYWDDANGVRSLVPGFTPLSLTGIVGDAIDSAPFTPPPGVERYVAVYQGALGQEEGAVIGKVGVGSRGVEELFIDAGTGDLYFRNRNVVAKLDIRGLLSPAGATISGAVWGNDARSFMVKVQANWWDPAAWAIFELSARPGANATWTSAPTATLVRQETEASWGLANLQDLFGALVLDSNRDILGSTYGEAGRGTTAMLRNLSQHAVLRDYGIAIPGNEGGGSEPGIVYADGNDLDNAVVLVVSWTYNWLGWWSDAGRVSVWVGAVEHIIFNDALDSFGPYHQGWDLPRGGPPLPQSTRRHVMFILNEGGTVWDPQFYLYDVQTNALRLVAQGDDFTTAATASWWGSANTGVDRLYDAGLGEFIVAWEPDNRRADPRRDDAGLSADRHRRAGSGAVGAVAGRTDAGAARHPGCQVGGGILCRDRRPMRR